MHARTVDLIAQVRASRAGAKLVIRPEHDVVGEQLRAPVEKLGERLLPVLGVELVLLLHPDPGKLAALFGHLLAELRVLGLELRELISSSLPFLAASNFVVLHRSPPLVDVRCVKTGALLELIGPLTFRARPNVYR